MARKRRSFQTFSLSFLDVMSCGFGAVVLIFLLLDHSSKKIELEREEDHLLTVADLEALIAEVDAQVKMLEIELQARKDDAEEQTRSMLEFLNAIRALEEKLAQNEARQRQVEERIRRLQESLAKQPEPQDDSATDIEKARQQFSGLDLSGNRLLILLDRSASMLDDNVVDIILRRLGNEKSRQEAPKWQRALNILDWVQTQLAPTTHFSIYLFNTRAVASMEDQAGWVRFNQGELFEQMVNEAKKFTPAEGTNLLRAFLSLRELDPQPDSILLITDSLPTQGSRASKGKVSGAERLKYFNQAVRVLPKGVAVNTILLPMEGDPMASPSYWNLARVTRGSFITPSSDWP